MGKVKKVKLKDVIISSRSGVSRKLSTEDIGYYVVRSGNIQNGKFVKKPQKFWYKIDDKGTDLTKYILEEGDILVNFINSLAQIGKAAIFKDIGRECIFTTNIFQLKLKENLLDKYFLYYSMSEDYNNFISSITKPAVNQASFTRKNFSELPIPLPPLPEQQRIVAKLDALFEKINKAIALLEENIQHTQALMGSVLDEEFGKLELLSSKLEKLKNLTTKIGSGSTPKGGQKSYKESGISLIRSMNVHDCYFKDKNLAFIDDEQAGKLKNVEIQENDVLLNITGASVARCCIVDSNYLPARVNQHVSIIKTDESLLPEFMLYFLISPKMKSKLLYDSSGNATREAITKSMIEAIEVPIITTVVQQKLIDKIKKSFSLNNELIGTQTQKLENLKALKSSLLDKAFKGEL